jgi:hypothetical protein
MRTPAEARILGLEGRPDRIMEANHAIDGRESV